MIIVTDNLLMRSGIVDGQGIEIPQYAGKPLPIYMSLLAASVRKLGKLLLDRMINSGS